MAPQFVDFNADGFVDIVTGTFDGSPHVAYGSAEGFRQPSHILDRDGKRMLISQYWDYDSERWHNLDGGQCISAVAFDWDNDGDYDLLLGDYKKGFLYLRMNEGTNEQPQFSGSNVQVMIGEKPLEVTGGMSAPRLVDWDADGLTDLVCGSFKGGVFLYRNNGQAGKPSFEAAQVLIPAGKIDPAKAKFPNIGCYADPVDYDGDGKLDLLVGGYAEWEPERRGLTTEEHARIEALTRRMDELQPKMQRFVQKAQEEAEGLSAQEAQAIYEKMYEDEDYKKLMEQWSETWQELSQLQPGPKREAGVWLYRRK